MNKLKDLIFDEERTLYNISDYELENIKFDGLADGESALKECHNLSLKECYFNLRYPLWHVHNVLLKNCEMTNNARAAIWYCDDVEILDSKLLGIKALRECNKISINKTNIESFEFGWKSSDILLKDSCITGEYLFFDSNNIVLKNVELKGKYSFQYVNNLEISDSNLDTKDAFWHANNVVVKNSVLKGEYLGWYSNALTLINCKIIGTQPLCYCKDLKLIDCEMINCDLSFENSEVNGNIKGKVDSIKNPLSGIIYVDEVGEIICDDVKYNCSGKVIINKK